MDDSDSGGKYDRQIRLWSSNGQRRLSTSNLLVIGVNITTTEVLKNLVLPGVGNVSIIDNSIINNLHIAGNFFLNPSDHGKIMSKAICDNLSELNNEVNFNPIMTPIEELEDKFWYQFNCIITIHDLSLTLINKFWDLNLPLIKVWTFGFYSCMRIQIKEQFIIETHDNNLEDLRIDKPWPELLTLINEVDIKDLNLPYSLILSKLFQSFENDNNNKRPRPKDIRNIIDQLKLGYQINMRDAYNKAGLVLKDSSTIPSNLRAIFDNLKTKKFPSRDLVWCAAMGLFDYFKEYKVLPLSGIIPDMESQSNDYIKLKSLYNKKFQSDKQLLKDFIIKYYKENENNSVINDDFLSIFTKCCKFMTVINGTKEKVSKSLFSSFNTGTIIYLIFMSIEFFKRQYQKLPTSNDYTIMSTLIKTNICLWSDLTDFHYDETLFDPILKEILRSNCCELHNIAAVMGGMCSQEVIKILTNHYIPIENFAVFNGIKGEAYSFKI